MAGSTAGGAAGSYAGGRAGRMVGRQIDSFNARRSITKQTGLGAVGPSGSTFEASSQTSTSTSTGGGGYGGRRDSQFSGMSNHRQQSQSSSWRSANYM